MGRRGRPPGTPDPSSAPASEPTHGVGASRPASQDADGARAAGRDAAAEADAGASARFDAIAGIGGAQEEPSAASPREPAPQRTDDARPESSGSDVDALAAALGDAPRTSTGTPWATATGASASAGAASAGAAGSDRERRGSSAKDGEGGTDGRSAPRDDGERGRGGSGRGGAGRGGSGRGGSGRGGGRRRGWIGGVVVIAVVLAIVGGLGGIGWAAFGPAIVDRFSEPEDFEGSGEGELVVRIESGWSGAQIAAMLEEEGVVADQEPFYDLLVADPSIGFQPGSYQVATRMSAQAALDALQDPENRIVLSVQIPEGFVVEQVFARLAAQTGVPEAEFVRAGSDPSQFGIPGGATSLEGWLFPATYTFDDGASATDMLQTMVDRMRQALVERGVPEEDWQSTLVLASLVEREAGPVENFGRVARVFQNRLDIGMLLQSDATVHYGIGDFDEVTTTPEERADAGNPYNTYVHPGPPVGPIGAPGDAAIAAVLEPEEGPWLYFVTVDPSNGTTVFSETFAEHEQAVLEFQQFLRENPEYGS